MGLTTTNASNPVLRYDRARGLAQTRRPGTSRFVRASMRGRTRRCVWRHLVMHSRSNPILEREAWRNAESQFEVCPICRSYSPLDTARDLSGKCKACRPYTATRACLEFCRFHRYARRPEHPKSQRVNGVKGNTYDLTLTAGLSGYSNTYKMFPFSMKYGGVEIRADDGSGENHTSKNNNQWITCDGSGTGKRIVVTYPTQAPRRWLR